LSHERPGLILGGGMTGLAAGLASGLPVHEAGAAPGGICRSYTVEGQGGGYRFEVGGGHWIFGGNPRINALLEGASPLRHYERRSAVLLTDTRTLVPYPLQHHLHALPAGDRSSILREIRECQDHPGQSEGGSLDEWLRSRFGATLYRRFFGPFHERYTAGLAPLVASEDREKTPLSWSEVERGASPGAARAAAGYNARFVYPACGLAELARRMGEKCDLRPRHRAVSIDPTRRVVQFEDGETARFERMISTLPLQRTLQLCGLDAGPADPYSSVRVLNLGARRGAHCPDAHWVYVSKSRSGFHRVGFYSNVDEAFLPESRRGGDWVSLYVERAVPAGSARDRASEDEEDRQAIEELQSWGYIGDVEVADANHVEVAYTWVSPGSSWRERALALLARHGVVSAGRYGSWRFQGIARSLEEGLDRGAELRAALT